MQDADAPDASAPPRALSPEAEHSAASLSDFVDDLRRLRAAAGLTLRQMVQALKRDRHFQRRFDRARGVVLVRLDVLLGVIDVCLLLDKDRALTERQAFAFSGDMQVLRPPGRVDAVSARVARGPSPAGRFLEPVSCGIALA